MNRFSGIAAAMLAIVLAAAAVPAAAQYATEFTPAKVSHQGTTTHAIAGNGTVKIQVEVNANGTHKVVRVISSTNHGDDAAAMDIAQNSRYTPAHKGKTPVTSFYDYVLKFNGKSVAHDQGIPTAGAAGAVDGLIRAGKYKEAIAKANADLATAPNDPAVLQLLGVAQYYDGDLVGSAATFGKVGTIEKPFQPIAAQAFATAAVKQEQSDPQTSLALAQKAMALAPDSNSRFALGLAQLSNKQYADAIANLKTVHDSLAGNTKAKINVDQELLDAYLATDDTANANAMAAEMKTLDPNGSSASNAIAQHYLQRGADDLKAKKFADALKEFDQAIAAGNPTDNVTANTYASFAILQMATPDYAKAKSYALKALATSPEDPNANYAAGIASAGIYAQSRKKDDKTQALDYLTKADQYAKAAGNMSLSAQVEAQIKNIPQ